MIFRGRLSFAVSSWIEWAPWIFVPGREEIGEDEGMRTTIRTFGFICKELVDLACGSIVCNNGETLVIHIENEVLALQNVEIGCSQSS